MKSWIFIGILLSVMGGAAYYYYTTTQERIEQLARNNATLVSQNKQLFDANQTNLDTIDKLQESYAEVERMYNELQDEFQVIRAQNRELAAKFEGHDLTALAIAKPELIEKIVNSASVDALRCLELLSGSPLNKKELAATDEKSFNNECPWLFALKD